MTEVVYLLLGVIIGGGLGGLIAKVLKRGTRNAELGTA
jgi:hypothetical protein